MSWCKTKLQQLSSKKEEDFTEDDWETYYYCLSIINSEELEVSYLNNEKF